ncbi:hypothetical protein DFJ58DRAFT_212977 [Suillus subalutaceus]|uniref:uncharacterized protein n=1 Tax=Suillus subalutaceus TaxID=48586 RepID=UPI001B886FF2|nr:uncharacterized protein DFJ58DRAFT_212977 [Suillus subalutaceus]KAG1863542.1 hypothetical protein DFJ58DRAFT_212977 [Suillus subalutaceus]
MLSIIEYMDPILGHTSSEYHNFETIFHGTRTFRSKVSRSLALRLAVDQYKESVNHVLLCVLNFDARALQGQKGRRRQDRLFALIIVFLPCLLAAPSHSAFHRLSTFNLSPTMSVLFFCASFPTKWTFQENDSTWLSVLLGRSGRQMSLESRSDIHHYGSHPC